MSIIGNNIGFGETLEVELKEFTLKKDPMMYYSEEEVRDIINTGYIEPDKFNIMITDNILHFFKYYIPKYLSVFGNSNIDTATLYMGVNDFGEITGVPFFGEITSEYLESYLDCIKSSISFNAIDNKDTDELLSNIKFEVIKLDKNLDFLDNSIEDIIRDFEDKKKKYEAEYRSNLFDRIKWMQKMEYYITRIQDYASLTHYRKEVSDYIIENNNTSDNNLQKISNLLLSNEHISVGDGNEIRIRRDNIYDVVHWITKYKDFKIDTLKENKPIKIQYCNFSQNIYNNQFSLLSNLRYKFISTNKNIDYYLIKIKFPTKFSKRIYFRNNEYDNWNTRTRAIVNGAPGCI
jgi:hypothetical protein